MLYIVIDFELNPYGKRFYLAPSDFNNSKYVDAICIGRNSAQDLIFHYKPSLKRSVYDDPMPF